MYWELNPGLRLVRETLVLSAQLRGPIFPSFSHLDILMEHSENHSQGGHLKWFVWILCREEIHCVKYKVSQQANLDLSDMKHSHIQVPDTFCLLKETSQQKPFCCCIYIQMHGSINFYLPTAGINFN
jgi:hypothetical protein